MKNYNRKMLTETSLLFLYILSSANRKINCNTFKRYLYLYYLSLSFFNQETKDITFSLSKSDLKIPYLDEVLDDIQLAGLVDLDENDIIIKNNLVEYIKPMLDGKKGIKGAYFDLYKETKPFVNLLISYDDQYVFRIFFSEPTFKEAIDRGLASLNSSSSKLSVLLNQFKKKIANEDIDDYDILTCWMDFVLKNYYMEGFENE